MEQRHKKCKEIKTFCQRYLQSQVKLTKLNKSLQ